MTYDDIEEARARHVREEANAVFKPLPRRIEPDVAEPMKAPPSRMPRILSAEPRPRYLHHAKEASP